MDPTYKNSEQNAGLTAERPLPVIPDHELLRPIGRGSYGTVWLARSTMGMYRAVKVVYRSSFSDQKPFERELSGIRRFEPISRTHEGFLDILQVGINAEQDHFYCVMELGDDRVSGQAINPENYHPRTLGEEISLRHLLPFRDCLELGLGLSQALAEMHKRGLVHRDVKPSNIIYVNAVPKLTDIGLVADFREARSYVGTEGFIPPEGPGTPQADVYGLGKVLYEASTGKDRKEFPDLPTLLEQFPDQDSFLELNEIILHACKTDISKRYQSAWEMYADFVVLANGKSVRRLKVLERRVSNLKRVGGILLALFSLLGVIAYQLHRERQALLSQRQAQVTLDLVLQHLETLGHRYSVSFSSTTAHVRDETTSHAFDLTVPSKIQSAFFSQCGRGLLITYYDHNEFLTSIYEVGSWKKSGALLRHRRAFLCAAMNGVGDKMVTSDEDFNVIIWDISTGKQVTPVMKHDRRIREVFFGRDDQFVVTISDLGTAQIWNSKTGQLLKFSLKYPWDTVEHSQTN